MASLSVVLNIRLTVAAGMALPWSTQEGTNKEGGHLLSKGIVLVVVVVIWLSGRQGLHLPKPVWRMYVRRVTSLILSMPGKLVISFILLHTYKHG